MSDVLGPLQLPPPLLPDLALSRSAHDRMAAVRGDDEALAQLWQSPTTSVLLVRDGRVPVLDVPVAPDGDDPHAGGVSLHLVPAVGDLPPGAIRMLLGRVGDRVVTAVSLPADVAWPHALAPGVRWAGLRDVGTTLDDAGVGLAVEAVGLDNWHRTHPRCPRCGAATEPAAAGHERRCAVDGSAHHPRSDPAVIMMVIDAADRVLLGRQATWPPHRYSVLAGFVEPGESLEAAVARETFEEAGITVGPMRYLGSQPWPFPASVMIAFEASATTTDIHVDGVEITEAHWFGRDQLGAAVDSGSVVLPPRLSIARRMLERWARDGLGTDAGWP